MTLPMVTATPLTSEAFAPYGDVLEATGTPDKIINAGLCGRFHDQARMDFGADGRACLSIFEAQARTLPYRFDLLERHPLGSQAFMPMSLHPFLVIVAPDTGNRPGQPEAFVTQPGQGVNFLKGTWHGVLTPLHAPGLFVVVDREGPGANLEEVVLPSPVTITV